METSFPAFLPGRSGKMPEDLPLVVFRRINKNPKAKRPIACKFFREDLLLTTPADPKSKYKLKAVDYKMIVDGGMKGEHEQLVI